MTQNRAINLNEHLFEQLERLNDEELTPEQLDIELKRTEGMVKVSNSIIANEKIQLEVAKTALEYGKEAAVYIPQNLMITHDKKS